MNRRESPQKPVENSRRESREDGSKKIAGLRRSTSSATASEDRGETQRDLIEVDIQR